MIKECVFLTQTDTTVGFVSQNSERLTYMKQRPPHKYYIKALNSLTTLKKKSRIPPCHRQQVRRAKRTTFILPNGHSYRVVYDPHHLLLLGRLTWAYTTSANLSGEPYKESFATRVADIVIYPLKDSDKKPSKILKLGKHTIRRMR